MINVSKRWIQGVIGGGGGGGGGGGEGSMTSFRKVSYAQHNPAELQLFQTSSS